eukprot:219284-Rhodomonas_salina.2
MATSEPTHSLLRVRPSSLHPPLPLPSGPPTIKLSVIKVSLTAPCQTAGRASGLREIHKHHHPRCSSSNLHWASPSSSCRPSSARTASPRSSSGTS